MKKALVLLAFSFVAIFAAGTYLLTPQSAQTGTPGPDTVSRRDAAFDRVRDKSMRRGTVRVIVGLDTTFVPVGQLSRGEATKQHGRIRASQNAFLSRHYANRGADDSISFDTIPYVVITADASTIEQMRADGSVLTVDEDVADPPHLAESVPLVKGNVAWSRGFDGTGWAVAIIDSGAMRTHDFLSGRVIEEACYSQTTDSAFSVCPGGVSTVGPGSGVNCDPSISGCSHGTHVAGIAAGKGTAFSGVARNANIVAIQVFSKFPAAEDCGSAPAPCALSYSSDQIRALERVLALSSTTNIAAVNMSLGGGQYTSNCDAGQTARKAAIDNLRSVNIATVASSGNNGYTDAMGAPGCISTAFSVGSTGDGSSGATVDGVVSSSNSASFLNFLAPGRWINSSYPSTSGSTSNFSLLSGTSMAAPHVTGAFAVLRQRKPAATVNEIGQALSSSGTMITDARNNLVKPRINIEKALDQLECSSSIAIGQSVSGGLTGGDCFLPPDTNRRADTWVFFGNAGQKIAVSMASNSLDAYLYLVDTADQPLAQDNDGGGGTNARIPASTGFYTLPYSGTYAIKATSNGPGGLGEYDLSVTSSCSYSLAASSAGVPAEANAGSVAVTTDPATGCSWTATSNASWITITTGSSGSGSRTLTYSVAANPGGPRTGSITIAGLTYTISQAGGGGSTPTPTPTPTATPTPTPTATPTPTPTPTPAPSGTHTRFDYDGDGKADLSLFRPSLHNWYTLGSAGAYYVMTWGVDGDQLAPSDYDGDGKTDIAVFRPSTGVWYVVNSTNLTFTTFTWGGAGDMPVPSDWNADGKSDLVIFRPSNNTWYANSTASGPFAQVQFGAAGDKPVVGDFDGDGKGDVALYRPSNNNWYLLKSGGGFFVQTWGQAGDVPFAADFDGDGKTDQAVFRPSTGQWFLSMSASGFANASWGQAGDIPAPADYDGDGKADLAIFRPSNATWYIINSTAGILQKQFGQAGDVPTAMAFNY